MRLYRFWGSRPSGLSYEYYQLTGFPNNICIVCIPLERKCPGHPKVLQFYIARYLRLIQYQIEISYPLTQPYTGTFCQVEYHNYYYYVQLQQQKIQVVRSSHRASLHTINKTKFSLELFPGGYIGWGGIGWQY